MRNIAQSLAGLAAMAAAAIGVPAASGRFPTFAEVPPSRKSRRTAKAWNRNPERDSNGVLMGVPGSKLARKAAKGSVGLYGGRRGIIANAR